jgi:hypothetical protein
VVWSEPNICISVFFFEFLTEVAKIKNKKFNLIYIIIWLSPDVLSVRSLSPPKLAGLATKIFRRHAPNRDSEKKNWKKKFHGKFSEKKIKKIGHIFLRFFLQKISMKTRSVA